MLFVMLTLLLVNLYNGVRLDWPWEAILGVPLCVFGLGLVVLLRFDREPPR